ncbi:flagellar biosynthetic protein FliO [Salibacterium sp. K-3]
MNRNKTAIRLTAVLLFCLFFPHVMEASPGDSQTISDVLENEQGEEENGNTGEDAGTSEESTETTENMDFADSTNVFSMLVQLFLALGAVIALMYILLKFINKRTQRYQSNRTMQNLGGVPLGQNKSVQLVKVGGRLLVVGVGDSIQLLKEIEEEEEIEELLEPNRPPDGNALKRLQAVFPGKNNREEETDSSAPSSFQQVLESQLGEMKKVRKKVRRRLKEYDQ